MSTDELARPSLVGRLLGVCWKMGGVGMGLASILGGLLYLKQDSLLYYPEIGGMPRRTADNPRGYRHPGERNLDYQDLTIPCSDGVHLHAWLIQHAPTAPTILFFHGNAGNIGLRLPNAFQMVQRLQVNLVMVEYRGYGNSDSVAPTERGLKLDAEAALRFCQKHSYIDPNKLFLFGRSLGGAVAVHLAQYAQAQKQPLQGVLLENTFTSISDMVDQLLPFLTPIKWFVLRLNWDSVSIVPHLHVPILFLAGAKDELVPHRHMQTLYRLAQKKTMHVIQTGTHNESWVQGGAPYWEAMYKFIHGGAALQAQSSSGTDTDKEQSSIPMMKNGWMGMAKDAFGTAASHNDNNNKDSTSNTNGFKKEL